MFSGGISAAALEAFRAYLPSIGVEGTHTDAELEQLLTNASSTIDRNAAAMVLGEAADAGRATRGSGIHGGAGRYTRAISGSKIGPLEIAAKAFLFEELGKKDARIAGDEWIKILNDFMVVKGGK